MVWTYELITVIALLCSHGGSTNNRTAVKLECAQAVMACMDNKSTRSPTTLVECVKEISK